MLFVYVLGVNERECVMKLNETSSVDVDVVKKVWNFGIEGQNRREHLHVLV